MHSADSPMRPCARLVRGRGRLARGAAALSFLCVVGACRSSSAPRPYRDTPAELTARVSGSWVEVRRLDGLYRYGELIAATGDTLFAAHGDTLHAVPRDSIDDVELTRYRPNLAGITTWTTIGMLSTISHGWFLILTAPTWAVSGIGAAVAETHRAIWRTRDFERLAPYARFPAGLPPQLDRAQLREAPPPLRLR